jgi:hypothetical protein
MSDVELDWASAQVRDGKLEVGLHGELPKGWKDRFERTVALLPPGEWGKVSLKRGQIRVHEIPEGGEERLHHFLESVVLQANTVDQDEEDEGAEKQDAGDDAPDDHDVAATERFRSFADEPQD